MCSVMPLKTNILWAICEPYILHCVSHFWIKYICDPRWAALIPDEFAKLQNLQQRASGTSWKCWFSNIISCKQRASKIGSFLIAVHCITTWWVWNRIVLCIQIVIVLKIVPWMKDSVSKASSLRKKRGNPWMPVKPVPYHRCIGQRFRKSTQNFL